jgi:hypothetical protein
MTMTSDEYMAGLKHSLDEAMRTNAKYDALAQQQTAKEQEEQAKLERTEALRKAETDVFWEREQTMRRQAYVDAGGDPATTPA